MKKVGIVGATGAVGKEILQVLFDKRFPITELVLLASERSAGKEVETPFGKKIIMPFSLDTIRNLDIVFLAVGGDFAKEYAVAMSEAGPIVIDNSSAFRYNPDIPLVIPQINSETMRGKKLIANPNCTTAILAMPLFPIYKAFGLKKVIVSTYQATSGAGLPGMEELERETKIFLEGDEVSHQVFPYPIAFNLIPQIDIFLENKYTKEEMKVDWETKKIFSAPHIAISCTAVRIPILRAHSESVTIETEKPVNIRIIREILANTEGVDLVDVPEEKKYPMPLTATKKYNVEVGRIRKNYVFGEFGLDFFISGDQLLRGAALNAVEIAEKIS
jgi:aspartate-semialdehyde dehydrogenase